jgi:hypothetical protein
MSKTHKTEIEQRRAVSQTQVTDIFVNQLSGHCLNSCKGPNGSTIEFWDVGGRVIIVQLWKDGGWEYYVAGQSSKVEEVALDIRRSMASQQVLEVLEGFVERAKQLNGMDTGPLARASVVIARVRGQ